MALRFWDGDHAFDMHALGTGKGIDGITPRDLAGPVLLLTSPNLKALMISGDMMMLEAQVHHSMVVTERGFAIGRMERVHTMTSHFP